VFGPPDDWNDFAAHVEPSLKATSRDAVGAFLGIYHYAKLHPVFEELPARGLMRQPYRNVVAPKTFAETGDEDICGTFDTTPIASGSYMLGDASWWGNDILVKRLGAGRIVFTHLRILEHLGEDPVADRLFVNMVKHFARRSVPSIDAPPLSQYSIDWLHTEHRDRTRLWMTIGMFPNWGDAGHHTAYPPEARIDLDATYPGWYGPISWRRWHSRAVDDHVIDLQEAFAPVYEYYPRFDYGTGYAYAEFYCDQRQDVEVKLGVQDATKVWINSSLVFENQEHCPHKVLETFDVPGFLRQGKNTVLVKVSKIPGEFRFALDLASTGNEPLKVRWWS
jgi:hypothetical protein